ncbi:MAG TPA: DNA-processing protein DprA [Candidatus Hydrogenedentes bacterium]|nr:DNA-processing protein DprA [Candidatus Hydrogenedentota bacterium]HQH51690.1 DNA-processing protein DprA [Candidatus Hydrogenedentota bacterium]
MKLTREDRDWLRLALVPGVGTAHFIRLLARFRTPSHVFEAPRGMVADLVGSNLADRIRQYSETNEAAEQEAAMEEWGVTLITMENPRYPLRLAEIYDPPLLLFARGGLPVDQEPYVALVGTRRASPYGIRMAEKLAQELAVRGITVVSGMAMGIDAAAHRGALEAGGRTIAVLGCGVDIVYPPQNEELMRDIAARGAVISQFPMGTTPSKGHFPYRNRIISGMSLGTVVIEAPLTSGALITARQAAEQGREVFAVPGQAGMHNAEGPHALIREGAKLVERVEDILVELELPAECLRAERSEREEAVRVSGAPEPATVKPQRSSTRNAEPSPEPVPRREPAPLPMDGTEKAILEALSPEGSYVDEIATSCRLSVSEALSSLTMLELKGLVRQFSGKRFAPR